MSSRDKYIKLLSNKFITEISLPADLLENSEIQSVIKQYEWTIVGAATNEWYKLIKRQVYHS